MDEIVADKLTKTFPRGITAVADLSFAVGKGEVFGLLGPNGAGKSTTVRILATLTRADGGRASVAGHDVFSDPAGVRRDLGYVAQASGVDRWQTGRENLVLQGRLQRVPGDRVAGRAAELLAWVGLTDAAARMVNTYSGGMKRRLDIAMGLVHEPRVLFLDEPTTGLDPETRRALWTDLKRIRRERGLTVLLTTHYLEEADNLCDRIAIVDNGHIVAEGTPDQLKAEIGGDRLTLGLAAGTDGARAAAIASGVDGVFDAELDDGNLGANVADGPAGLPRVVAALSAAGIGVTTASAHRPSLDDVYLHHTGHRFDSRDAAS